MENFKGLFLMSITLNIILFLVLITKHNEKPIIYQVDSHDSLVLGRVEKKTKLYDQYQLVIDGNYYQVTKEQYDSVVPNDVVFTMTMKGE